MRTVKTPGIFGGLRLIRKEEFATVLPGVTVRRGAIIGTSSVVTRDVPPNSIVVGAPTKVIKVFNEKRGVWEKV